MNCLETCLVYSKCLRATTVLYEWVFILVLRAEAFSNNAVICNWWVWTLGLGGHPDDLLQAGPVVGAGEKGGWASWFGRHKAPGQAHKPVLIFIAQGCFLSPLRPGRLSRLKPLSVPIRLEAAPVNELSENPSSSSLGSSRDFRRMGSPTPGKRDRVGRPPLSRPETTGDPRERKGLGEPSGRTVSGAWLSEVSWGW